MLVCDIKRGEGNYLMEVIPYGNGTDMTCHAAFIYHRYDLSHVTYLKKIGTQNYTVVLPLQSLKCTN